MQRLLANRRFASSERHCRLLRYLLGQTLDGRAGQLKEYILGVEVFEREESFDPQTDPIVRTELSRLRAKLKDYYESDGRDDGLIIGLPKRSYSLSFQLKEAPAANSSPESVRSWLSVKRIAAASCIIAVLTVVWVLGRAKGRAVHADRLDDDATSVAVLPFVNLSADRDADYFSDGLTEEIIHCLGEIYGLRVVSRTSAFQFKGKQEDVRAIAARLNVEMVVEGTVRRSGDRLRVTIRLVDAADGQQLSSHAYEHRFEDILTLQQEIAHQVASALRVHQTGGGGQFSLKRFTKSSEAYRLYLEGRHHANNNSESELWHAIRCYERAIAADPKYAPAHAGRADAYVVLALENNTAPGEAMLRAKEAAQAAVRTGGAFSHAHSALGSTLALYDWDWAGAEKEFQRALELDPNDSGIREAYAMRHLLPQGRLNSALFEMQLAQGLDPFSPGILLSLGKVHHYKRDPDRAIKAFEKVLHLEPQFEAAPLALATAYVQKRLVDQAVSTLQEASAPTEDEARLAILGCGYALSHRPDQARQVLEQLREVARQRYVSGYYLAKIHLALGERAEALDWLERAAAERSPLIVYVRVNPLFDSLHGEPRFAALVKKVGLAGLEGRPRS